MTDKDIYNENEAEIFVNVFPQSFSNVNKTIVRITIEFILNVICPLLA